ncbi:MAG: hypothetical protein FWC15_06755 [Fibromonadales bacterium]|nr:hypothetical protein [Fibromonadales bacterium]
MKLIAFIMLLCVAAFAQQKGTLTDPRDGKKYKTVKIGTQTWMAENLNYHGTDGYLGLCHGDEPQEKIKKPENCKKYGRLYGRKEVAQYYQDSSSNMIIIRQKEVCPEGWHLPSHEEWVKLLNFVDGKDNVSIIKTDKADVSMLKTKNGWEYEYTDDRGRVTKEKKNGTDEYGFSALPGGWKNVGLGLGFTPIGASTCWWAASGDCACIGTGFSYEQARYLRNEYGENLDLYYVRCIQDN